MSLGQSGSIVSLELLGPDGKSGIDPSLIERHVDKILVSTEFARSGRMARFLRYVIHCQLEGRTEDLKERLIGIEVFDRPADWDPKMDTIVRSEARRLRTKLEQYYSTAGLDDVVRIVIPKGGYAPEFSALPGPAPEASAVPLQSMAEQRRIWIYNAALLVALSLGFAGWAALKLWRDAPRTLTGLAVVLPFANEFGAEINPAISPDGKTVAYAWDGNGDNYDIYLKSSNKGPATAPTRLTWSPEPDLHPAWSPDGKKIAFVRLGKNDAAVIVKSLATGEEQVLTRVSPRPIGWVGDYSPDTDMGPSWLPDGQSLVISDGAAEQNSHTVYRVYLPGGERHLIIQTHGQIADFFPRVSPDGRQLALVRYTSHGVSDLFLCSIDGSNLRQLTFDRRGITGLAWNSDGRSLYYTAGRQGSQRIWKISTAAGAVPQAMPDSVEAVDISVGPGGEWVAYAAISENWNIWRMALVESPRGSTLQPPQRFIASSGRNHGVSYSPDGKQLAFISDRTGSWQIWLGDPDGGHLRQLTQFDGGFLGSITWTPDSKRIAFDARPSGNANIYLLDVDRHGTPVPLEANRFEERMPAWSSDGRAIYFNSNRDGTVAIWRKSLTDGTMRRVGLDGSFKSLEAPAGDALYFNTKDGRIYRSQTDGSTPVPLPGVVSSPEINWTISGIGPYYTREDRAGEIGFLQFAGGGPKLLLRTAGQLIPATTNLTVSRDRKWLVYAQRDHLTSDIVLRRFTGSPR